jgi:hypothetical protein
MKIFFLLLLLVGNWTGLLASVQTHQYLYYYQADKNHYIDNATIIINGRLLDSIAYGAYVIPEGIYTYGEKMSLTIIHPDYQDFFLDSVVLIDNYLHAIKRGQLYYLSNGIPQPIINTETQQPAYGGYDCITVLFSQQIYKTKDLAKEAWQALIKKYKLKKGYSYQEAIDLDNDDLMWGCRQQDLNYTFGIKKRNGKKWKKSDRQLYQKMSKEVGISFMGVALERSKIMTNKIEIYYGTKDEIATIDIEKIERKFGLKRISYFYDSTRYYYTHKGLITNNKLLQRLMRHSQIKQARLFCLEYEECG